MGKIPNKPAFTTTRDVKNTQAITPVPLVPFTPKSSHLVRVVPPGDNHAIENGYEGGAFVVVREAEVVPPHQFDLQALLGHREELVAHRGDGARAGPH